MKRIKIVNILSTQRLQSQVMQRIHLQTCIIKGEGLRNKNCTAMNKVLNSDFYVNGKGDIW